MERKEESSQSKNVSNSASAIPSSSNSPPKRKFYAKKSIPPGPSTAKLPQTILELRKYLRNLQRVQDRLLDRKDASDVEVVKKISEFDAKIDEVKEIIERKKEEESESMFFGSFLDLS